MRWFASFSWLAPISELGGPYFLFQIINQRLLRRRRVIRKDQHARQHGHHDPTVQVSQQYC
ncbi:MAG TPA: hypothetical protein VF078_12040 [Nitrospira sp.]